MLNQYPMIDRCAASVSPGGIRFAHESNTSWSSQNRCKAGVSCTRYVCELICSNRSCGLFFRDLIILNAWLVTVTSASEETLVVDNRSTQRLKKTLMVSNISHVLVVELDSRSPYGLLDMIPDELINKAPGLSIEISPILPSRQTHGETNHCNTNNVTEAAAQNLVRRMETNYKLCMIPCCTRT